MAPTKTRPGIIKGDGVHWIQLFYGTDNADDKVMIGQNQEVKMKGSFSPAPFGPLSAQRGLSFLLRLRGTAMKTGLAWGIHIIRENRHNHG